MIRQIFKFHGGLKNGRVSGVYMKKVIDEPSVTLVILWLLVFPLPAGNNPFIRVLCYFWTVGYFLILLLCFFCWVINKIRMFYRVVGLGKQGLCRIACWWLICLLFKGELCWVWNLSLWKSEDRLWTVPQLGIPPRKKSQIWDKPVVLNKYHLVF